MNSSNVTTKDIQDIDLTKNPNNFDFLKKLFKDLSRVKASFESVTPQLYFEFCATFWHWLAQRIQNKVEEERL